MPKQYKDRDSVPEKYHGHIYAQSLLPLVMIVLTVDLAGGYRKT